MRAKFLYLAIILAAAFISTSCGDDDKKNPPLLTYFQVDDGSKYSIKWSAVDDLDPQADAYNFALSVGNPKKDVHLLPMKDMGTVFTFYIPREDMGRLIPLAHTDENAPDQREWSVMVKYGDGDGSEYFSTSENCPVEEATIMAGSLEVYRRGIENYFTIYFTFHLANGKKISGKFEGDLIKSDNVLLSLP